MITRCVNWIDSLLRRASAASSPITWLSLFLCQGLCGFGYGMVMGSYGEWDSNRMWYAVFAGLKVPLLFWVTFGLCVPVFFVLHALAGVAADFSDAVRALLATQAAITVVLLSLAPVTAFWYLSNDNYQQAVLFNGAIFGVASLVGQVYLRRLYSGLIARNRIHRQLMMVWLVLFIFVAIQFAWVLRPFVGEPSSTAQFFRASSWGNAYVALFQMLRGLVVQ